MNLKKRIFKSMDKIDKSMDVLNNINKEFIDYKIRSNLLLDSALNSTETITIPAQENGTELIVSLTTYDKRIHDVHLVIESIVRQAIKPNRLLLWLNEKEFNLETIPKILHRQIERGLEIRFCSNYRSYKKLIPTLQNFTNANVITIDDDFLYPHDMIEILLKEHNNFPDYIIGHRAHKIKLDSTGGILPYQEWEYETFDSNPSKLIFLTSGGGTLFPKNTFNKEVLDSHNFLSLCPDADDVWFYAMALLNNVKCKKVDDNRNFSQRFLILRNIQDIGLWHSNVYDSCNDIQLKAVLDKYKLNISQPLI